MFYFHFAEFLSKQYSLVAHIITTTQILFSYFPENFGKSQQIWSSSKPNAIGIESRFWYSFGKCLMVSIAQKANTGFMTEQNKKQQQSRTSLSILKHLWREQMLLFEIYPYLSMTRLNVYVHHAGIFPPTFKKFIFLHLSFHLSYA